jgi:hypothetical protein
MVTVVDQQAPNNFKFSEYFLMTLRDTRGWS